MPCTNTAAGVRAPELIKISIAGLAGAVLAEENCRIWVMQQITWELNPAGPAGKPRARCLYNPKD